MVAEQAGDGASGSGSHGRAGIEGGQLSFAVEVQLAHVQQQAVAAVDAVRVDPGQRTQQLDPQQRAVRLTVTITRLNSTLRGWLIYFQHSRPWGFPRLDTLFIAFGAGHVVAVCVPVAGGRPTG